MNPWILGYPNFRPQKKVRCFAKDHPKYYQDDADSVVLASLLTHMDVEKEHLQNLDAE